MFRAPGENVVIFLAVFALGGAVSLLKDECPPNEEYLICGSACPANCTNYKDPVVCTQQCVEGCFCSAGLVRNEKGTCVKPDQCGVPASPPTCGDNEEYLTCGTSCPATCEQPAPDICDLACRAGCFCKGEAVRDSNGKCVDMTDCPPKECPPNEEYLICGSACPANCTNKNPVACTRQCVEGCFCSAGLVRNENGICVKPEQCDKPAPAPQCGPNEEYLTCGPSCQATCDQPIPGPCILVCRVGCFCRSGTIRDSNGKCVDVDDCPGTPCLNSYEEYNECQGACEPSCADPNPICSKICMGGCICGPGTFRSDDGECVTFDKCLSNITEADSVLKYIGAINAILHL